MHILTVQLYICITLDIQFNPVESMLCFRQNKYKRNIGTCVIFRAMVSRHVDITSSLSQYVVVDVFFHIKHYLVIRFIIRPDQEFQLCTICVLCIDHVTSVLPMFIRRQVYNSSTLWSSKKLGHSICQSRNVLLVIQ